MSAFIISNTLRINKKNIVNLLFLIAFAFIMSLATHDSISYDHREFRNITYMFLAGVSFFFIHSIVLAPIKFEEKNNRKYLILFIPCIIALILTDIFLFSDIISRSSGSSVFKIDPNRLLSLDSLIRIIISLSIPILVIAILSGIYCWIVYGFTVISSYLEAFVHVVVITMVFVAAANPPEIKRQDICIVLPLMLTFFLNTFLITPILFKYKRPLIYLLSLITLILGCFFLQTILIRIIGFTFFDPETGRLLTSEETVLKVVFNTPNILILFIAFFLSFVYGYVRIKAKANEKLFNIKLGKKESELKLLKSQVNPHFLFNTLNTLYASALSENAEKTGASIAKLANLLRYMQKDISKDFIPLEHEIQYLQDYISIQVLRCAIEPQIETQFVNVSDQVISPGLFIPFVENAFKYGIYPSKSSKLYISVICDNHNIHFSCINSYNNEFKAFHKEQGFGIGINNARQRLNLVYPENHIFEINKTENEFSVKIIIPVFK